MSQEGTRSGSLRQGSQDSGKGHWLGRSRSATGLRKRRDRKRSEMGRCAVNFDHATFFKIRLREFKKRRTAAQVGIVVGAGARAQVPKFIIALSSDVVL